MSLLERDFGENVSDAAIKYYLSHKHNIQCSNLEVQFVNNLLFGDVDSDDYLRDRHYDMTTAENMLSTLASSTIGDSNIDFCIYYDDRINMLMLSEDPENAKWKYITSIAVRRDDDYSEDITNYITSTYVGEKLLNGDEDDISYTISRMLSILNIAEMSGNLISHLIIFENGTKYNIVEISPFGSEVISGAIYPIDITPSSNIKITDEAKNNDPLMTIIEVTSAELFSKICEISPNFNEYISSSILQSSTEVDLFMKEYLSGRNVIVAENWTRDLLFNEKFSDIMVESADGEKFPAHKLILSRFSKYFETLCYGAFNKVDVVRLDIGGTQIKEVFTYIYAGFINFHEIESVSELISAAEYLQIDKLTEFFAIELYS